MIFLFPILIIAAVMSRSRVNYDERLYQEELLEKERQRAAAQLQAANEATAKAKAQTAAAKQLGLQYLAMKPTMAGIGGPRRAIKRPRHNQNKPTDISDFGYRAELDLNGEDARHL